MTRFNGSYELKIKDYNNQKKVNSIKKYLVSKMSYSTLLHSTLFFFVSFMIIFALILNSYFFHANEIFYNDIEPLFENHNILIDEIEKDSPLYIQTNFKCNSNLIDLTDGNLKNAHDTIDSNQYTFIYM